jgi:hypothetical protein
VPPPLAVKSGPEVSPGNMPRNLLIVALKTWFIFVSLFFRFFQEKKNELVIFELPL